MKTIRRITALLVAATLTLSLCTVITPTNPTNGYGEEGIAPCTESDLDEIDYF